MKILIVDGATHYGAMFKFMFNVGWPHAQILFAKSGNEAEELVESESPDLVTLDFGLRDMSGLDALGRIRSFSNVPIIMINGRVTSPDDLVENRVRSLTLGADDCVEASLNPLVIFARIRALFRRTDARITLDGRIVKFGDVVINTGRLSCTRDGNEVSLSPLQWDLLQYLIRNQGRVILHDVLAEKVWRTIYVNNEAIQSCIHRLRKKLGDDPHVPRFLRTHHGRGYSLNIPLE
ncbi:MAG: response regulator transcription factor [Candidatus Colwellbacteria bacterium]|nr:response regulator transcription factor [Candidatus Colwellbacteria bacterium]